jgi:hypothetical protein
MTALELRKQLLIAESNLNRPELFGDMATLTARFSALTDRAKSIASITSSAVVLVTGLAAFRRGKHVAAKGKPSWPEAIIKGVSLFSTLWLAFHSQGSAVRQNRDRRRG